jgi:hypothetical protein
VCSTRSCLWRACWGDLTHHTCTHTGCCRRAPWHAQPASGGRVTAWHVSVCGGAASQQFAAQLWAARLGALGRVCVLVAVGLWGFDCSTSWLPVCAALPWCMSAAARTSWLACVTWGVVAVLSPAATHPVTTSCSVCRLRNSPTRAFFAGVLMCESFYSLQVERGALVGAASSGDACNKALSVPHPDSCMHATGGANPSRMGAAVSPLANAQRVCCCW